MKKISLPKIGIRPVIDGRRMGVRESLEEQTMNMAKATAALLTEKLRHACGAAVECVISIPVSRVWLKPLLAKKNSAVRM
ncbi:L-fucose isomerase [Escherichia coli]|nr:L-fucose isomerase [Escherichia coli]